MDVRQRRNGHAYNVRRGGAHYVKYAFSVFFFLNIKLLLLFGEQIAVYEGACWDYVLVNVLIAFLACFLKMVRGKRGILNFSQFVSNLFQARLVNGANEADQFLTAQTMERVARFH